MIYHNYKQYTFRQTDLNIRVRAKYIGTCTYLYLCTFFRVAYLVVLCTRASKLYLYLYPSTLQRTLYLNTSTLQVHHDLFNKINIKIYVFSYSVQYFLEYK